MSRRLLTYVLAGAGVAAATGWIAFFIWQHNQFTVGFSSGPVALRLTAALLAIGGLLGAFLFAVRR